MTTPIHSIIINKVARRILKEYGIEQKGQSRTWLDDQYWFTTIIEFQPFKDRKGTCLNVGANFHWYEKDYFSFDVGSRESEFFEFKNEEQFERELETLMELALKRTLDLREKFSDFISAENTIVNHTFPSDKLWGNYHRAIICGFNNKPEKSEQYFDFILQNQFKYPWQLKLKERAESLKRELNNVSDFRNKINEIIRRTRKLKKLKETAMKNVW
ncbi:MAG: hypothetical protein ACYC1Q_14490 [Bacteroidia bacterium]